MGGNTGFWTNNHAGVEPDTKLDAEPDVGSLLRIYGSGKPVRLFAAGLHGDEWKDTSWILEETCLPPKTGSLALLPLVSKGEYVSTLDERYYPGPGKHLLKAIEKLRPDIYVELHSYSKENFENLVGKDRIRKIGVPAFSILNEGVLLGSVSPHIRMKYFTKEALCLSFEVEKKNLASGKFVSRFVRQIEEMESRDEFIEYLRVEFPEQARKAIEDYINFYGEL